MKSIVTEYPDFQMLPKGIKQLLVASESLFFEDATPVYDAMASRLARGAWTPRADQRGQTRNHDAMLRPG
ncbi:MAG: hypothetical protein ACLQSR_05365 [Limisphaerales bacterium]